MSTWTLEVLAPFTVQQGGRITTWQPGQRMKLTPEHARRVLARVGTKVRLLLPGLQPGDRITWTRADTSIQTGIVDCLHVDETGAHWAFVTIGESWAAVNLKFVNDPGGVFP